MSIARYSDYFTTLYDENEPIGSLGRGTHYSVLRYASWFDVECQRMNKPLTHDFAVIWDEDHDTRIISAVERIFEAGLLSPIQFIGERKGFLSIVLAARFRFPGSDEKFQKKYLADLKEISADIDGDQWNLEVGYYDRQPGHQTDLPGMIACTAEAQETYLRNIDNLWDLGTWKFHRQYQSCSNLLLPHPNSGSM